MSLVDLSLQPPVNISKLKLKALKEKIGKESIRV